MRIALGEKKESHMRIRIETNETISESEIIFRCRELDREIIEVQRGIVDILKNHETIIFYQKDVEFYFPVDEVLFFETEGDMVCAHTKNDVYQVKMRLYELEERLSSEFMRISKSAICNVGKIYAIDRSITSICTVKFENTDKQVYVSRHYFKSLKNRISEMKRHL